MSRLADSGCKAREVRGIFDRKNISWILVWVLILSMIFQSSSLMTSVACAEDAPRTVTITFKKDGAKGSDIKVQVPVDTPLDLLFPTKGLHKVEQGDYDEQEMDLVGWSTKPNSNTSNVFASSTFDKDTTVWPVWKEFVGHPLCPVYFAPNGGIGGPQQLLMIGRLQDKIPATEPTRQGFQFKGWATTKDAEESDVNQETYIGHYTVLYAVWGKKTLSDLEKAVISTIPDQTYTGDAIEPAITLTMEGQDRPLEKDVDYQIAYSNNSNVGTAQVICTGKGKYHGEVKTSFTITPAILTNENVSFTKTNEALESSENFYPAVTVTCNGKKLTETEYSLVYPENAKKPGIYQVIVEGKGNYSGRVTKEYTIREKQILNNENIRDIAPAIYRGKPVMPKVEVQVGGKMLEEKKDYVLQYENNKRPGIGQIEIKGRGEYKGIAKKNFVIVPTKIKGVSATLLTKTHYRKYKKGKRKINKKVKTTRILTLNWQRQPYAAGYCIVLFDGKHKKGKKVYVENPKKTFVTVKNANASTKKIEIHSYVVAKGKRIYGEKTIVKKIKKTFKKEIRSGKFKKR